MPASRHPKADRLRGLYVIVDPEHTAGRPLLDVARAALNGGANVMQLRDKLSDKRPMLERAEQLQRLCDEFGAAFFVNDHADVARIVGSDGLHVGQSDLPVEAARQVLAPGQMIGTSTHNLEEAGASQAEEVDYLAVGAIYGTGTKTITHPAGVETLARVRPSISVPVAAIGGINVSNAGPVLEAGADMICVISAVSLAPDPEAAARELVDLIERARSQR
ncbi:MAG: thiamine phosphate synthase [Dehalococcoidia bacterium]